MKRRRKVPPASRISLLLGRKTISHLPSYLLDAGGVEADARQRGGGHGVRVQRDWVGSVRAVAVPKQEVL